MKLRLITTILLVAFSVGITGCNNKEQSVLQQNGKEEASVTENNQNEKTEESEIKTETQTANEEQDAKRNIAYADVLEKIYEEQIFPDGTKLEYMSAFGDIEDNSFAIADVDGDGVDELIFIWGTDASAGMSQYVFKYNAENNSIITELIEFPGFEFYKGGLVTVPWSHNQGNGEMWPYNIYEYDENNSEFEFAGYVEGWNKELSETDYEGKSFPEDIDKENKGVVYRIKYGDEYNEEYYSQSDYDAFYEKVISSNEKLDIKYFKLKYMYIELLRESKLNPVIKGKIIFPNEVNADVGAFVDAGSMDGYIENLKDGIYHVNIDIDDIYEGSDDEYSVYADIYLRETYDIVDMNTLEVGDGIECDGIVTKIESIENNGGAIYINGGIDVGGLNFVALDESNCYVYRGYDDIATYRKLGFASLEISKDSVIYDKSNLDNLDGVKVESKDFKDYVINNNKTMCVYNTIVTVENGKIADMTIYYMP